MPIDVSIDLNRSDKKRWETVAFCSGFFMRCRDVGLHGNSTLWRFSKPVLLARNPQRSLAFRLVCHGAYISPVIHRLATVVTSNQLRLISLSFLHCRVTFSGFQSQVHAAYPTSVGVPANDPVRLNADRLVYQFKTRF